MIQIKHKELEQLALEHYAAIEDHIQHRSRDYDLDKIDNWFERYDLTLKKVICADHENLKAIAVRCESASKKYPPEIQFLRDNLYEQYFTKSSKEIGRNGYSSALLIKKLGITVCPYCNRNFINNIEAEDDDSEVKWKKTGQLDHFFSKDQYPFLAMSFYNLIPCCASCNHKKQNNSIPISPYDSRADFDDLLRFDYSIQSADFKAENIQIELDCRAGMRENVDTLGLRHLYQIHTDQVYEILKKAKVYPKSKQKELRDNFPDLFRSQKELERTLFGNYLNTEDLSKRPLAKLTNDIYTKITSTWEEPSDE